MYTLRNGNKVEVNLMMGDEEQPKTVERFTQDGEKYGSNKMWLYIALLMAVIAAVICVYYLYRSRKSDKVGYQLY